MNLFDIVRGAQSGRGVDLLSRQFGLSVEQTQLALEALLPAFSLGLQRNARNPNMFGQLLDTMMSGRYVPFWTGAPPAGPSGSPLLDQIFGSREVSRQVADQAAAATGIATQVIQGMLPQVAAMVMGGLGHFTSVEGFADFLRGWADWLKTLKPEEAAASSPYRAWSDAMASLMGAPPARAPALPPPAGDPWTSFTQAFLAGSQPAPPPPKPPAAQPNPFEVLTHMFETGREVQAQHMAGLQAIFDGFWGGARPR